MTEMANGWNDRGSSLTEFIRRNMIEEEGHCEIFKRTTETEH